MQTLNRSGAGILFMSASRRPTSTRLNGFLWQLGIFMASSDSVGFIAQGGLGRGGFQREGRPQYIADAKTLKHKERRHCEASEDILTFGFVDLICIFVSFVCCGLFFFSSLQFEL